MTDHDENTLIIKKRGNSKNINNKIIINKYAKTKCTSRAQQHIQYQAISEIRN
jgi:hypothetical protein